MSLFCAEPKVLIDKTEEATKLMADSKQEENSPERIFSFANISVSVSQSVPQSPFSDHKSRINLYDCKNIIIDSTSWSYYYVCLNFGTAATKEVADVEKKLTWLGFQPVKNSFQPSRKGATSHFL